MKAQRSAKTAPVRALASVLALIFTFAAALLPSSAAVTDDGGLTVPYSCPAICAVEGDTVKLGDHSVQFESGKTVDAKKITWSSSDIAIDGGSVTPAAGIYILTAAADGKKKTVVLTVRAKNETDYVLYRSDFSGTDARGLRTIEEKSGGKVKYDTDGSLILDASSSQDAYARVLLPEYLDGFGDIKVEARMKLDSAVNSKRWASVMLRVQTAKNYPYMQLCLRYDASLANGTEIAERTVADKWNVTQKASASIKSSEFNTVAADASGSTLTYLLNGKTQLTEKNVLLPTGAVGFQANGCRLTVDEVKVTVGKISDSSVPGHINEIRTPDSNVILPPSSVVPVESADALAAILKDPPVAAILNVNTALDVTDESGTKFATLDSALEALGGKVIAAFRPDGAAAAKALSGYLSSHDLRDVFVISDSAEVLSAARAQWRHARGVFDFTSRTVGSLAELEALRAECNTADCRVMLLSPEAATRENVEYLRMRFMTVWTRAASSGDADLVSAIVSGVHGIITDDCAKLDKCLTAYFGAGTLTRVTGVTGHRGVPSLEHQNTVKSSLRAYELGATMIENDLHLSRDGVIMVMHNSTIDATTNGKGTVASMTRAELAKYLVKTNKNLAEGDPIPTLEDYIKALKDKDVVLQTELKSTDPNLIPAFIKLVKQYDYEDKVIVVSFSTAQLERIRKQMPGISAGLITSNTYSSANLKPSLSEILNSTQSIGTVFVPTYGKGSLDATLIRELTLRGVTVWTWTVNSEADFARYFVSGVSGITTDSTQFASKYTKYLTTDKTKYDLTAGEIPTVTAVTYERKTDDVTAKSEMTVIETTGDLTVAQDPATGAVTYTGTGSAKVIFSAEFNARGNKYRKVSELVTLTANATDTGTAVEPMTDPAPAKKGCSSSLSAVSVLAAMLLTGAVTAAVSKKRR